MSAGVAVVITLAVAVGAWAFMFLPPRRGVWRRTWIAAGVLLTTAVVALAAVGRLAEVTGPVDANEVLVGLAAGGAWLVATHVGAAVLGQLIPAFRDQIEDLYRLGDEDTTPRMVGAVMVMGVAEEVVFRGVVQGLGGVALALVAYTGVQAFERKWALALAALLGGAVWGGLFAWRGGLVAPAVAHVLWTGVLTFVWTLEGPATGADPATRRGTARGARA